MNKQYGGSPLLYKYINNVKMTLFIYISCYV